MALRMYFDETVSSIVRDDISIWVRVTFAPTEEPTLRTDLRHWLHWLEAIAG